MTDGDIRAIAHRIVEKMVVEYPVESATIASLVLSEILAIGLFGGDEGEAGEFADALNVKLCEIALHHGAPSTWCLTRAQRPHRH
jgi:hypothetical protein